MAGDPIDLTEVAERFPALKKYVAPIAKAIVAGVVAAVGSLILVVSGAEGFSDVELAEWLMVIANTLGAYGITWAVPNKPHKG